MQKPTSQDPLHHPDIWRAGQIQKAQATQPSSFACLDAHLPGGGWPLGSLCELLLPRAGIGELQLLAPALAALSARQRWIIWIDPPFVPYAPALESLGIDTAKILLVRIRHGRDQGEQRTQKKAAQDALWALEKASRSGTCSAALAWLDERYLRPRDTQRLQVAAGQGRTLTCLFRPEQALESASMAALRLRLEHLPDERPQATNAHRLNVHIAKRRGGWAVPNLKVTLNPPAPRPDPQAVQAQLELWRSERQQTAAGLPLWQHSETAEAPLERVH